MLENGEYSVWYHTPRGESAGRLVLENGKITGEGPALSFSGSYITVGDDFFATVKTWRRVEGIPSVAGVDNMEIVMTGKVVRDRIVASCKGYAMNAPEITLDATLLRIRD